MQKRAPTLGNILVIILFALSCFGLLLFLWESFGGPVPLKPKGYRFTVAFPRTLALAEQSDVRISGVDVGHVIALHLGSDGLNHVTVEISHQYAPLRRNTHAIIRQKTLLGETYMMLIPQGNKGPYLADNAELPKGNVEKSVTLDDILAAFDPKTRAAFKIWQQELAKGINGRGEQINANLAQLEPFVENARKLVSVLNEQEGAVRALVHNTGTVFNALASRDHQLEGSIVNGEHTLHALAEASKAWAETFKELPAFQKNSTKALQEVDKFQEVADPYFEEFRPAQRQLASLLKTAEPFAPEFDRFNTALGPLTKAAKKGLPQIEPILNLTVPVLENFRPVLHNLDPFLQYTGQYVPELTAFFANITAASAASLGNSNTENKGPKEHYLTTMSVLSPESLAVYPKRIGTDRSNAYPLPGTYHSLASGLPVFSSSACAESAPTVSGPANETITESVLELITKFKVANKSESKTNEVPAPGCNQQGPFTFNGKTSQFPHAVYEEGK
jgi:phospholipid/cholesterol/gamma-HCH transport system substrate-binding protein